MRRARVYRSTRSSGRSCGPQSVQSVPNSHQAPDLRQARPSLTHPITSSWQIPSPAVRQVSRHFEVVPATTSASAKEVQMNASHASHARSSEEADMRLLRFRCGIESLTANAPAVLGAMALGRPLRFCSVWKLGRCIPSIVRRHFAALRHFCNRLGQKVECKMSARESVWRLTGGRRGIRWRARRPCAVL